MNKKPGPVMKCLHYWKLKDMGSRTLKNDLKKPDFRFYSLIYRGMDSNMSDTLGLNTLLIEKHVT